MAEETKNTPPEFFNLEYVDSKHCHTIMATGAALSGPTADSGMFQLTLYTDVSRVKPQRMARQEADDSIGVYKAETPVTSELYREVQARVMLTPRTLVSLAQLLANTATRFAKSEEAIAGEEQNASE